MGWQIQQREEMDCKKNLKFCTRAIFTILVVAIISLVYEYVKIYQNCALFEHVQSLYVSLNEAVKNKSDSGKFT